MLFPTRLTFAALVVLMTTLCSMMTTTTTIAFSIATPTTKSSSSRLFSSTPQKPDLVDQTLFKAAIARVEDEIEAQYKAQKVAEGTALEDLSPEEKEWLEERRRQKEQEVAADYVTMVGKLDVTLPIDTQPELDLTESIGPLVLVTSCWGQTAEKTGIQEFDTLTKVSVNDASQPFVAKTKCTTLEETAGALTAAAQHAIGLGKTEIELEVQRLIKGYYAPPPQQQQ